MRRVFDIVYWMDICQLCVMYVGLETSLVFILHVLYSIHSNSAAKSAPSYSICPPWVPSTPENVLSSIASGSCANASDVRVPCQHTVPRQFSSHRTVIFSQWPKMAQVFLRGIKIIKQKTLPLWSSLKPWLKPWTPVARSWSAIAAAASSVCLTATWAELFFESCLVCRFYTW